MTANVQKKQKITHNYYSKNKPKHKLEPGQKGFLVTCNFREKDCVRECYNILNEYASKTYQLSEGLSDTVVDEDKDISEVLENEITTLNAKTKHKDTYFQNVDTGTTNCIFIKTTLKDPVELGVKIIMDLSKNQVQKSRFLLRFVPILTVCRANLNSIIESAGKIFDDFFLKGNIKYCIQFNKRYNNVIDRMEIIHNLAELIHGKNPTNKVDLRNAKLFVIVEIIKGLCLISVVPDYLKLKKFNIAELSKPTNMFNEKDNCEKKA